ncbi:MAG: hypothetical protein SNH94_02210 [Rikenellaceae bacterium]
MKRSYQEPQIEVVEIAVEDAILSTSSSEDQTENVREGITTGDSFVMESN